MDLFEARSSVSVTGTPLAEKLRPRKFEDFVGQEQLLGKTSSLSRFLERGWIPSLILWGPPGCGKTTLAHLICQKIDAEFITQNAVEAGAKLLRQLGNEAKTRRSHYAKQTILFIDEIHRLNKSQQDVLLPFVEQGDIVLIGATTENPSYELNNALLSRCHLVKFSALSEKALLKLLRKAIQSYDFNFDEVLSADVPSEICRMADGDGRRLINMADEILRIFEGDVEQALNWPLKREDLAQLITQSPLKYDKSGDDHYDTISAFIKCIRGSDPDAALYYLARMLKAGEDAKFIARRLVILASEDVGNADPRALTIATSGFQAVECVGLPEAAINLAQVVTYLASAPKSNRSYMGLRKAQAEVEQSGSQPIPLALRNPNSKWLKQQGYGQDYKYSHDGPKGFVKQSFLPKGLKETKFYEPIDRGFEKNIRQFLSWLKEEREDS